MMAEGFAGIDITDVYLDDRCRDGCYAVVQGDAGVAVCAGVEYDAVAGEARLLQLVYQLAFHITLIIGDVHFRKLLSEDGQIVVKRRVAVDVGLTVA